VGRFRTVVIVSAFQALSREASRPWLVEPRQSLCQPLGLEKANLGAMSVGCHLPIPTTGSIAKRFVHTNAWVARIRLKGIRGGDLIEICASFCPSIFLPIIGSDDRSRPDAYWLTRDNTDRRVDWFGASQGGRTGRGKLTPTRQMHHGS
jgi:hypothetical protein